MQSSPQDPLTRFLPKTVHWAPSQGGSSDSHWKKGKGKERKGQGKMKSFFFFPFSFFICIGKWGVNVSFDVSKSSFAQLQRNGDLSRVGGRVKESTAAVLVRYYRYMCCTLSLNNQLRRRPWLQTLNVLLQFTSPVFTKYLLSFPLTPPPKCKRLSLTPNPRTPNPRYSGPSAPPPLGWWVWTSKAEQAKKRATDLWHQLLCNTEAARWCVNGVTSTYCSQMLTKTHCPVRCFAISALFWELLHS